MKNGHRILEYHGGMEKRLFKYYICLVLVAMYFFVWNFIQKFRSLSHLVDTIVNNQDSFDSLHFYYTSRGLNE